MERFRDTDEGIWSFFDDVLVLCPACGGQAHVRSGAASAQDRATFTCQGCGRSRRASAVPRPRRCPHCRGWIPAAAWESVSSTSRSSTARAVCPACRRVSRAADRWTSVGAPEDPVFGLPLFLQVPCCGETLWAFNARHLAYLDALARARVRERGAATGNRSMASRLPRWMKSAKNREAVIAGLERLRTALASPPGKTSGPAGRR